MLLATSHLFESTQFALEKGGELASLAVAYETYGTLNEAGDNGVLVCHGYTNNQHAAGDSKGWFSGLIGPGKAVDTNRYFVVATNMLGSAFGSTGPQSINPASNMPYGLDFPDITVGDMVNGQIRLLDNLGVKQLAAVIGNSFGGHLAFHWATTHPEKMRAIVVVVSAIKGRGDQATVDALLEKFGQCPGWNGGQYYGHEKEAGVYDEMLKTRIQTLKQYGYDNKIREDVGDQPDIIEQELVKLAVPWAEQFDANSLIVLRKAAIQFDARPNVANMKAPLLYVLSRSDNLFPPSIAPDTIKMLRDVGVDARFFELDSDNGHRAPSVDWPGWTDELEAFLKKNAP
jgi:homoserine O-acetyltransferase